MEDTIEIPALLHSALKQDRQTRKPAKPSVELVFAHYPNCIHYFAIMRPKNIMINSGRNRIPNGECINESYLSRPKMRMRFLLAPDCLQ
jgi:hypothetical protein